MGLLGSLDLNRRIFKNGDLNSGFDRALAGVKGVLILLTVGA